MTDLSNRYALAVVTVLASATGAPAGHVGAGDACDGVSGEGGGQVAAQQIAVELEGLGPFA